MGRPWQYEQHRDRRKRDSYKAPSGYKSSRPPRRKFPWNRTSLLYVLGKFWIRLRRRWNSIPISVRKLFLSLLVIIGLVLVAQTGYLLFTHQTATVRGTIIFLAGLGFLIWIIPILRSYRYRRRKPSFKLVFFSLLGVVLVCAFAGIEPLTSYKDRTISFVEQSWQSIRIPSQFPTPAPVEPVPTPVPQSPKQSLLELEEETFRLINVERNRAGAPSTNWDAELYKLSKAHTREMADRGELFHTPIGASYAENCWMGIGYSDDGLPRAIVDTWVSSPLHRAWLLHEPIRASVVSIVRGSDGVYASWTFWMSEVGEGPALVRELSNKWREETGGSIPWLEWLKMKGYL